MANSGGYLSNLAAFILKGFRHHSVKEYYNASAVNYDAAMKSQDELVEIIIKCMPECEKALDIAMGTGITSVHMKKKCKTLVSLDFSDGMISEGRKKLGLEANIIKADFLHIPLKDNSVEVSACTGAIRHIPGYYYEQYFSEISRVTKECFITEARRYTGFEKLFYNVYGFCMGLLGHNEQPLNSDMHKLRRALSSKGFRGQVLHQLMGSDRNYILAAFKMEVKEKCQCP